MYDTTLLRNCITDLDNYWWCHNRHGRQRMVIPHHDPQSTTNSIYPMKTEHAESPRTIALRNAYQQARKVVAKAPDKDRPKAWYDLDEAKERYLAAIQADR